MTQTSVIKFSRDGSSALVGPVDVVHTALCAYLSAHYGVDDVEDIPDDEGHELFIFKEFFSAVEEGSAVLAPLDSEVFDADEVSLQDLLRKGFEDALQVGARHRRGDTINAWRLACRASLLLGIVTGTRDIYGRFSGGSVLATNLAKRRHQKTYQEREVVADYWRDHVDRKMSAQKAATVIEQAGITNLSHKKIAEIVSLLRKGEPLR